MESWKLSIGCWNGTITSRDSDIKTVKPNSNDPLQSLEDCKECVVYWGNSWADIGYRVWFAEAIAPDGTRHKLKYPLSGSGQYQASKKLVEAICAGEGISEADAVEILATGGDAKMLETGRNPLYAYLPELSTFRKEFNQAIDRDRLYQG